MNQLVAGANGGNLPAFLQPTQNKLANQMSSGLSQSYPNISLKGAKFTFNKGGESTLWNQFHLDVIIVGASEFIQRTYYSGAYDPNATETKPACSSQNGEYPSAQAEFPQAQACSVCPMNQKVPDPQRPGKQHTPCGFSKNLAVVIPGDQNVDIWRLGLNSMTLFGKSETDAAGIATWRGITEKFMANNADPMHYVVRLSFDPQQSVPVLKFQIIGTVGDGTNAYDEAFYNALMAKMQFDAEGNSEATKVVGDNLTDTAALPAPVAAVAGTNPVAQPAAQAAPVDPVAANQAAGAPVVPVAAQQTAVAAAHEGVVPAQPAQAAPVVQQPAATAAPVIQQPAAQPAQAAPAVQQPAQAAPVVQQPAATAAPAVAQPAAPVVTPAQNAITAAEQAQATGANPAQAAVQAAAATPAVAQAAPAVAQPAADPAAGQVADTGVVESDAETANLLAQFGTPAQ